MNHHHLFRQALPFAQTHSKRRGIVAVQVAVLLFVIVGFAVLSVDVGKIYNARGDMQRTVDASSLAGASNLMKGNTIASSQAVAYATVSNNAVFSDQVDSSEVTVQVGNWEGVTRTFTPVTGLEVITPNAVRVEGLRPSFALSFATLFGMSDTTVVAAATSTYGGGVCSGIWGLEGVSGTGSIITDSYNSEVGEYGPGNINANGDICSCQDIDINGSVEIHGDAMYGDGYAMNTSGSTFEVWGSIDRTTCNVIVPEYDLEAAEDDNDNNNIGLTDEGRSPFQGATTNLRLTGFDNLTLPPGVYYFNSVRITGQATITITGETTIYIAQTADLMGGGLINTTEDPHNLTIYAVDDSFTMHGGSGFYGAVIAPNAVIDLFGNTGFFGLMLGNTLHFNGDAMIHVDESLVQRFLERDAQAPVLVQ